MKYYTTIGIDNMIKENKRFSLFVQYNLTQFLSGNYGEAGPCEDYEEPIGIYKFDDTTKIWITKHGNIITVLFPNED